MYSHIGCDFPTKETFEYIVKLNDAPMYFSSACPHRCIYFNNNDYPNRWSEHLDIAGKKLYSCRITGKIFHVRHNLSSLRRYIILTASPN
jgi:hypothetical protein